jgi:hypothetical protein
MEKLMRKIMDFIEDLFIEDFDEDVKEVVSEGVKKETKDHQRTEQTSRLINPLVIIELALSTLITIPLFSALPMSGSKLFDTENNLYFEHLIILVVIAVCIFFLFQVLRKYMYAAVLVLLLAYAINQKEMQPSETFLTNVVQDYKTASRTVIEADISFLSLEKVKRQHSQHKYLKQILKSEISSKSRNFAINASVKSFNSKNLYEQYGNVVRYLSLFQHITENFNYVNDPVNSEYYTPAEETIDNGCSGDCDDRAVLIYVSVKAIGGRARLIRLSGHMYPEVMVGSSTNFEFTIIPLLDSLYKKEYAIDYFHHVDNHDNVWLSFDFGEFPGAYHHYSDIEEIMY